MNQQESTPTEDANVLKGALDRAAESIHYFLLAPKPIGHLRALLRKAQAGVAVDLIVPLQRLENIGLTGRYPEKLVQAGGRFFLVDLSPQDWQRIKIPPRDILLIDDQKVWLPTARNSGWYEDVDNLQLWRNRFNTLREVGAQANDLKQRSGHTMIADPEKLPGQITTALSAAFHVDKQLVNTGGLVRLQWTVHNATSIVIEPDLGKVRTAGNHVVRVTESTEFTLTAKQGPTSLVKVLKVDVDRKVEMKYWLMTSGINAAENPVRLKERSDLPGRFGVLEGQRISLHWQSLNAEKVSLDEKPLPFSGEWEFKPEGLTELQLRAEGVLGDSLENKIVINTFSPIVAIPNVIASTDSSEPSFAHSFELEQPVKKERTEAPEWEGTNVREELKGNGILTQLKTWWKKNNT